MPQPQVLILYNRPVLPPGHPDAESEEEILATVATARQTLTDAGLGVRELGVGRDPRPLLAALHDDPPDVVFNLFEGLADQNHTEITAAGLLEWAGVPFTGSPAEVLALARNKVRTKYLLQGAGLPTPPFFLVDGDDAVPRCPLDWPVIVKPALQDASVGIEQSSVVTGQRQLERQVALVRERFGPPVLVERFVFGRELLVTLVERPGAAEPELLPLSEIRFIDDDPKVWPIYSYTAKWKVGTRECNSTPLDVGVRLEPAVAERVARTVRAAYRLTGCRDYARIDLRLTAAGEPVILEVNANPFLNSMTLTEGLTLLGRRHMDFLLDLVRLALARQALPAGGAAAVPAGAVRPAREHRPV
jgi:D-alanine-D-alanine ligase